MTAPGDGDRDPPGRGDPDLALAHRVADVVAGVRGVARLDGGPGGLYATWRRGRRCVGVRITGRGDRIGVRVVAASPRSVADLDERVRTVLRRVLGDLGPVDVYISDVEIDGPPSEEEPSDRLGAGDHPD